MAAVVPSLIDLCSAQLYWTIEAEPKPKIHSIVSGKSDLDFFSAKISSYFQSAPKGFCANAAKSLPSSIITAIAHPKLLAQYQLQHSQENIDDGWKRACSKRFPSAKLLEKSTWEQTYFSHLLDSSLSISDFTKVPAFVWDLLYNHRHRIHTLYFDRNTLDDTQLIELSHLYDTVEHLELRDCRHIKGQAIEIILKEHGASIRTLKLIHTGWKLDQAYIGRLLLLCPHLESSEILL